MKIFIRVLLSVVVLTTLSLLSACHEEDFPYFHGVTPEVLVPLPTITPGPDVLPSDEVIPEEEVGEVVPEPEPEPPCEIIKGNISTRTGEKIYHVPGGANYNQVKIDEAVGEAFFCSEEEAQEAGFRKAAR